MRQLADKKEIRMHKLGKSLPLLAIVGLSLMSADRATADTLGIAAAVCTPFGGAVSPGWTTWTNSSTTETMALDCAMPIAYDPPDWYFAEAVTVTYVDKSSVASVDCSIKMLNIEGTVIFTGASQSSGVSNVANFSTLRWFPSMGGAPYVSCIIPKATGSASSTRSGLYNIYTNTQF